MAYNKEARWKEARKQMLSLQVSTIRKSKGMSVNELAEKAGYEPATIRRIESGTFLPDQDRDIALANALGISLDQLWGRKRFEFYDSGQPKLHEYEKIALTLLGPILKALSPESRETLLTVAAALAKAEGTEIEWGVYIPGKSDRK